MQEWKGIILRPPSFGRSFWVGGLPLHREGSLEGKACLASCRVAPPSLPRGLITNSVCVLARPIDPPHRYGLLRGEIRLHGVWGGRRMRLESLYREI